METRQQKPAIEELIFSFSDAFNAKDISKTVSFFTPDGINMLNNGPAAQGTEALTKAFTSLFGMAEVNVDCTIDEIIVSGEQAIVRTNSEVITVIKASKDRLLLQNKELFILRQQQNEWKISHYIFNNTKTSK